MTNDLEIRVQKSLESPNRDWRKWIPIYGVLQDRNDSRNGRPSIVDWIIESDGTPDYTRRTRIGGWWSMYHFASFMGAIFAAGLLIPKYYRF